MEGFVKFFDPVNGFGVLNCPEMNAELKFKLKFSPKLPPTLRRNQRVSFDLDFPENLSTPVAVNMELLPNLGPDGKPIVTIGAIRINACPVSTAVLRSALARLEGHGLLHTIVSGRSTNFELILILSDIPPNYRAVEEIQQAMLRDDRLFANEVHTKFFGTDFLILDSIDL